MNGDPKTPMLLALELLTTPLAELPAAVEKLNLEQAAAAEMALDFISYQAASLAAYIDVRRGTGNACPRDHAAALEAANKRRVKVRRALGRYANPERDPLKF